jgi:hypothetical protein
MLAALGWYFFATVPIIRWIFVVFFGGGALIFAVNLLPGSSYLKVSPDGITYSTLYKCRHYAWEDIDKFGVMAVGMNRTVGMSFSSRYSGLERTRKAVATVSGYEGSLPDTYGMKAKELADMLNALKAKHAGV